ncbi:GNAT family N-acetyltransferase [Alicyclobacillus dauci]|uniref:GNAT family N-acetyltransferase n=1 Tax=Alicyclobacillus dauci TaxID=1475485 RepID=A0ABY6YZE5_9BACL|nr:GNAT family N-acetyltransferase [Alicyclobacillus dauci]WAH35957.1 GNAT family N-acetyltransferase [Alicyclobacillus dauci]
MSSIEYRFNAPVTGQEVADVFKRSGINRPTDDVERIQKMIDHGNLIITAWDEGKLVGIARSLTDFCYCCYLSDLAVDKEYQHSGVGKELIHQTQMRLTDQVSLLLLSAPTAMTYYPKVGFDKAENAWIIRRKR